VESDEAFPEAVERGEGFVFSPGCTVKPTATSASIAAKEIDVQLRNNEIQIALHAYLAGKHGESSVRTEQNTGNGTFVDVVARTGNKYWFYEIKTSSSARTCIREGLAQLLEYPFWPGAQEAERLVIVGEAKLDSSAKAFLECLQKKFSLPIYYQSFDMKLKSLV
jgi:Holliday junction resolvase